MSSLLRNMLVISSVLALPLAAVAVPDPTPDPNAAVVLLRTDCGTTPLENCFETMSSLTTTGTTGWIWQTRNPSASAPLLVDVGPGTFGTFSCDGTGTTRGFVTLRGSGREQSIVKGGNNGAKLKNCRDLSFIDIGVHGNRNGVLWEGAEGGSSSWSNVDLVGIGETIGGVRGWSDTNCVGQTARSVHYFHGSRVRGITAGTVDPSTVFGFYSGCAENWFFGGEILVDITRPTDTFSYIVSNNGGFVELFGTAIRGRVTGSGTSHEMVGIAVYEGEGDPAAFPIAVHSHGSNIGINTSAAAVQTINAYGIIASDDVHVHAPGTAYALTSGSSAQVSRVIIVSGSPDIEAPYHWSANTTPPYLPTNYGSKNGEDLFVETDCDSAGCSGSGTQPHLMIYSTTCPAANPWWDVARNACRQ